MATATNSVRASGSMMPIVGVYFFVFLILEGLQRVSGIFFLETKESLDSRRLLAAVPFALSKTTAYFVGVAVEYWREKQKPGTWIICGSFVSALGIGICFFTSSIIWWSLFWGILFGAGVGIASPILVKELSQEKNSRVTLSLKSAGSSFGCVIFPIIINLLVIHYGLNGCYAILSGLVLNCIPSTIISICEVKFHFPKTKWPFRKRSSRYQMPVKEMFEKGNDSINQSNAIKVLSKQSFLCNLEPDTLEKVPESERKHAKHNIDMEGLDILKPIIEAKHKMVIKQENTSGTPKPEQDFLEEASKREEYYKEKVSELVSDIRNYEKNRMAFEQSFSNSDKIINTPVGSVDSNEFLNGNEQNSGKHGGSSIESSEASETLVEQEDTSSERKLPEEIESSQNKIKNGDKKNVTEGMPNKKDIRLNIPFEIKVHVVECTVTTNESYLGATQNHIQPPRRKGYRRHSNSLISGCYDNVDFTKMFQHKKSKSSPLHKLQCNLSSRMFLISEDDEFESENRNSSVKRSDVEAFRGTYPPKKPSPIAQVFYDLAKPSCLVILYTSVIFEFTLALLLMMFADLAEDHDGLAISSSFVLVAFGLGGLLGQWTFSFGNNRLFIDGSHAATAIIFLLNGLSVAGILWSTNVRWLSGFYATFGFIESAILVTFPRLISDYIEKKAERVLSWTCRCVTGIAILFVPYAIGFSRDEIGDYDGLLQVTSCLSVLCSILCYFLPRIVPKQPSDLPTNA